MDKHDKERFSRDLETNLWYFEVLESELSALETTLDTTSSQDEIYSAAIQRRILKKLNRRLFEPITAISK